MAGGSSSGGGSGGGGGGLLCGGSGVCGCLRPRAECDRTGMLDAEADAERAVGGDEEEHRLAEARRQPLGRMPQRRAERRLGKGRLYADVFASDFHLRKQCEN